MGGVGGQPGGGGPGPGEEGLAGNGKGGWRDVHIGAALAPGADTDSTEEAAAYTALGL